MTTTQRSGNTAASRDARWIIGALALLGLVGGLILSSLRTPIYEAEAIVSVRSPIGTIADEVAIASGPTVLDAAEATLTFRPDVSVSATDVSNLLTFTARSEQAEWAADAANVVAGTYTQVQTNVAASIVDFAEVPTGTTGLSQMVYTILGTLLGLVLGVGVMMYMRRETRVPAEPQDDAVAQRVAARRARRAGGSDPEPATPPQAPADSPPLVDAAHAPTYVDVREPQTEPAAQVQAGVAAQASASPASTSPAAAAAELATAAATATTATTAATAQSSTIWSGRPKSFAGFKDPAPAFPEPPVGMTDPSTTDPSTTDPSTTDTATAKPATAPAATIKPATALAATALAAMTPAAMTEPEIVHDEVTVSADEPVALHNEVTVSADEPGVADASTFAAAAINEDPPAALEIEGASIDLTALDRRALKAQYETAQYEYRLAQDGKVAHLVADHERIVAELRNELSAAKKELRLQGVRLQNRSGNNQTRVGDLEAQVDALEVELAALRQHLEAERIAHTKRITEERGTADRALDNARREYREEIAKHLHTHRAATADHQAELDTLLAEDRAKHALELEVAHASYERALDAERVRAEAQLEAATDRHQREMAALVDTTKQELDQQAAQHKDTIGSLRNVTETNDAQLRELEKANRAARSELSTLHKQARHLETENRTLIQRLNDEISVLKGELDGERERNAALRADVLRRSAEAHQVIDQAVEERTAQLAELETSMARQRDYADRRVREISASAEEQARQATMREASLTATISRLNREIKELKGVQHPAKPPVKQPTQQPAKQPAQ